MAVVKREELQKKIDEQELSQVDQKELSAVGDAIDVILKHSDIVWSSFQDFGTRKDRTPDRDKRFMVAAKPSVCVLCGISDHLRSTMAFRLMRRNKISHLDQEHERILHLANMQNNDLWNGLDKRAGDMLSNDEFSGQKVEAFKRVAHDISLIAQLMKDVLANTKSIATVQYIFDCVINIPALEEAILQAHKVEEVDDTLRSSFLFVKKLTEPASINLKKEERPTAPNDLNGDKLQAIFSIEASPDLIAERLRKARKAKGWTQLELAKAMGLKSKRAVQNLENAREGVTLSSIRSAMEALEIKEL